MKYFFLCVGIVLFFTACTTGQLPNLDINTMAAGENALSAEDAILKAESFLAKAHSESLDYYAPKHLAMAQKHLNKARKILSDGGKRPSAVKEALFVAQIVKKGIVVKETVLRQLKDLFDMNDRLLAMNVRDYFSARYLSLMDTLNTLIYYIEKEDHASLGKKKPVCLRGLLALEVDVVKKKTLSKPEDLLKQAQSLEAEKLAPKTYLHATEALVRANGFIESNPRDDDGVAEIGLMALRACQHALYVTREVMAINAMNKKETENLVLDFEGKLHRITQSLQEDDVRHMSLYDQSVTLSQKAEALTRRLRKAEVDMASLSEQRQKQDSPNSEPSAETAPNDPVISTVSLTGASGETKAEMESDPIESGEEHSEETMTDESTLVDVNDQSTVVITTDETMGEESISVDAKDQSTDVMTSDEAMDNDILKPNTDKTTEDLKNDDGVAGHTDKSRDKPVKQLEATPEERWNGKAESFNMDDLFLSDEEREQQKTP